MARGKPLDVRDLRPGAVVVASYELCGDGGRIPEGSLGVTFDRVPRVRWMFFIDGEVRTPSSEVENGDVTLLKRIKRGTR